MSIWAIDREIEELEIELRSIQESKASVNADLKNAWRDKLSADAVAALVVRGRDCEQLERRLSRRLERLLDKRSKQGLASEAEPVELEPA